MAVSNILNYAGILIQSADGYVLSGGASNVEANWDTPATLWDGGAGKRYIFWGDTSGDINLFEFAFSSDSATNFTLVTNSAYDGDALSIRVNLNRGGSTYNVMYFNSCAYNPGFQNKRLRTMGDRLVLEKATNFKIIKTNNEVTTTY